MGCSTRSLEIGNFIVNFGFIFCRLRQLGYVDGKVNFDIFPPLGNLAAGIFGNCRVSLVIYFNFVEESGILLEILISFFKSQGS